MDPSSSFVASLCKFVHTIFFFFFFLPLFLSIISILLVCALIERFITRVERLSQAGRIAPYSFLFFFTIEEGTR